MNAVFVQVRPDGDAMYPSKYFPWSKFASGQQGKDPGYDPLAYVVQSAPCEGTEGPCLGKSVPYNRIFEPLQRSLQY